MNILNKLTIKHLKLNKKRTIVTIIGIILSTALMIGIGTLFSSFREFLISTTIKAAGDHHVTINDINYDNYKYIKNNVNVKKTYLTHTIGYSKLEGIKNEDKPYLYIIEANDNELNKTNLIEGRYPKNNNEVVISNHIISNGKLELKVGDEITLNIGNRYIEEITSYDGKEKTTEETKLSQNNPFDKEEYLKINLTKKFKIVGIIERPNTELYQAPGYTVYSKIQDDKLSKNDIVNTSIIYKDVKDAVGKTEKICKTITPKNEECNVDYNNSLLSLSGQSSYSNLNNTFIGIITIVLILITLGCAIVIYNSFAISVMERKKQFGLFSSIGATKTQLRKTVFFEAFIVSIIGIPLGILSGIFGIYVVLNITNSLLPSMFNGNLHLSLYPTFIIIPILYMILTIIISAYLPSKQAAKISPIEAIRLNDDIKISKKSVKGNKIIRKLFGIEGELAYKNIKRNKKKYRITILSLFVSIVLFISFSTFLNYGNESSNDFFEIKDYDIQVSSQNYEDKIYNKIISLDNIEDYTLLKTGNVLKNISNEILTDKTKEIYKEWYDTNEKNFNIDILIFSLDDKSYKEYLKELKLDYNDYKGKDIKPILINKAIYKDYSKQKTTEFDILKIKTGDEFTFDLRDNSEQNVETKKQEVKTTSIKTKVYVTNKFPKYFKSYAANISPMLVLSESMMDNINQIYKEKLNCDNIINYNELFIKSKKHGEVTKNIKKIKSTSIYSSEYYVSDITEDMEQERNLVIVVGIFLYGFISLVTLIGITSVFNTINTSIALRRKEFAILRSVGLTPKGFNRMLRFESILYGIKALIYSLPVAFIIVCIFHEIFGNVVSYRGILIPWKAIIISIVGVFVITFLTMIYASKKIKKENILDAIREENI